MTRKQPSPPFSDSTDGLARLERQLERGSLFTHTELSKNSERIREDELLLHGIINLLIEKGLVTEDELAQSAERAQEEMDADANQPRPGIALTVDDEHKPAQSIREIDCDARIHLCRAACCRMSFALTAREVQAGRVKWDHGQPYYIRQEANGYCSHQQAEGHQCDIYRHRPGVCRRYTCIDDARIWKDFDAMEINREWIDANLGANRPQLVAIRMVPQQLVSKES